MLCGETGCHSICLWGRAIPCDSYGILQDAQGSLRSRQHPVHWAVAPEAHPEEAPHIQRKLPTPYLLGFHPGSFHWACPVRTRSPEGPGKTAYPLGLCQGCFPSTQPGAPLWFGGVEVVGTPWLLRQITLFSWSSLSLFPFSSLFFFFVAGNTPDMPKS